MSDPKRFIGRRAAACKKCSGCEFYVNRMGGLVCLECSPPRTAADNCQALTIEGGVWIDPDDRFDMVDIVREIAPAITPVITSPNGSTASDLTSSSETLTSDLTNKSTNAQTNNQSHNKTPSHILPLRSSRGPNGELSEAELDLFSSAAVWGAPANRDLITTYGNVVVWVSTMFEASDEADRLKAINPRPMTKNPRKEGGRPGSLLPT